MTIIINKGYKIQMNGGNSMAKYLYYCVLCNDFYEKESEDPSYIPTNVPKCAKCNTYMRLSGISVDDWEKATEDDKNKIRKIYKQEMVKPNSLIFDQLYSEVRTLSHDVHTLYVIVMILVAITIIGFFLLCMSGLL